MSFSHNKNMRIIVLSILCLALFSCRSKYDLAMERGIHLYQIDDFNEAITEFKYVIAGLSSSYDKAENHKLLSEAHKKLALAYAKKAEQSDEAQDLWYEKALEEIKKSIDLLPDERKMIIFERIKLKVEN
tara:strand:+ start:788 stop:1177 length:390 start_codon:yes stop_codon:yes gene_type:complete